jgi:predicted lipid carrier protein YhbT
MPLAPTLPQALVLPLALLPAGGYSAALALALNRVFASQLDQGELGFLEHRTLLIRVRDAGLRFGLTLSAQRLRAAGERSHPDVAIEGTAYDFLLLATRREDADTLFFNRRLRLSGDTELGLNLKNFLDAVEPEAPWASLIGLLDRLVPLIEQRAGQASE